MTDDNIFTHLYSTSYPHQKSPAEADFILSPGILFGSDGSDETQYKCARQQKGTCFLFNFIVTRPDEVAAGNGKKCFTREKEITWYSVATPALLSLHTRYNLLLMIAIAEKRRVSDSAFLPPPSQQLPDFFS